MKNHIKQFIDQLPPEYKEFENIIIEFQSENEKLKLELAKLIDMLRLPSLFSLLSQLEKDSIKHSEQALKEQK